MPYPAIRLIRKSNRIESSMEIDRPFKSWNRNSTSNHTNNTCKLCSPNKNGMYLKVKNAAKLQQRTETVSVTSDSEQPNSSAGDFCEQIAT